jgi:ATP-binding cassette subfamily B protein/ATP-binding cassette subfamily C protein
MNIFKQLRNLLSRKYKIEMVILVFLAVLFSLIEAVSVSSVMPFISIATNNSLSGNGAFGFVYDLLPFTNKTSFIIIFGFIIIALFVIRGITNIIYIYGIAKFSFSLFRYFSTRIFRTYLSVPYLKFLQCNSSELTEHIVTESTNSGLLIFNLVQIISEAFIFLLLYIFMLMMQWKMTLLITGIILIIGFCVSKLNLHVSKKKGIELSIAHKKIYTNLISTFGNYKIILSVGNKNEVCNDFDVHAKNLSSALTINNVLYAMPRCILETIGFSLLVGIVIFVLWQNENIEIVIPIISMFTLALYRMLPSISRILSYMTNVSFYQESLNHVYEDINQKTVEEGNETITFNKSISIKNLTFNYIQDKNVLTDIELVIKKGEKIAVIGDSGSGKSTLIDMLIGMHNPKENTLYVDDIMITNKNIKAWRKRIGYIPQSIYLFDGTIGENISFGAVYNESRIIEVLKNVKIWDFLQEREGINTNVGDNGAQLSGGQKQRIGIARALYNNPDILVLDEATSALDMETEMSIMDEIYDICAKKTLIVISHRLTAIAHCDRQIELKGGKIT